MVRITKRNAQNRSLNVLYIFNMSLDKHSNKKTTSVPNLTKSVHYFSSWSSLTISGEHYFSIFPYYRV